MPKFIYCNECHFLSLYRSHVRYITRIRGIIDVELLWILWEFGAYEVRVRLLWSYFENLKSKFKCIN